MEYFSADFLNKINTPEIYTLNKVIFNFSTLFTIHQTHSNNYLKQIRTYKRSPDTL